MYLATPQEFHRFSFGSIGPWFPISLNLSDTFPDSNQILSKIPRLPQLRPQSRPTRSNRVHRRSYSTHPPHPQRRISRTRSNWWTSKGRKVSKVLAWASRYLPNCERDVSKTSSRHDVTPWKELVQPCGRNQGSLSPHLSQTSLHYVTIPDSYSITRMDWCIDSLGDSIVYSALDENWGYCKMAIVEKDYDRTTLVTHLGAFHLIWMPFWFGKSPLTFQRSLELIISRVLFKTCLVYLDNVLIFSGKLKDHIKHF